MDYVSASGPFKHAHHALIELKASLRAELAREFTIKARKIQ